MTIARVEGICNGANVMFSVASDGTWDVTVPAVPTGMYTVSVTAYDEAGNSAYRALMLFSVDLTKLEVKVMPLHFSSFEVKGDFAVTERRSDFAFTVADGQFSYKVQPFHFRSIEDVSA